MYLSHGTLVIVPSNLVEQWVAEVHKVCREVSRGAGLGWRDGVG